MDVEYAVGDSEEGRGRKLLFHVSVAKTLNNLINACSLKSPLSLSSQICRVGSHLSGVAWLFLAWNDNHCNYPHKPLTRYGPLV